MHLSQKTKTNKQKNHEREREICGSTPTLRCQQMFVHTYARQECSKVASSKASQSQCENYTMMKESIYIPFLITRFHNGHPRNHLSWSQPGNRKQMKLRAYQHAFCCALVILYPQLLGRRWRQWAKQFQIKCYFAKMKYFKMLISPIIFNG